MRDNQQISPLFSNTLQDERERRWRLILGKDGEENQEGGGQQQVGQPQLIEEYEEGQEDGDGSDEGEGQSALSEEDQAIDDALNSLYGEGDEGGLGDSAPDIALWLGDIRKYFPEPAAHMLQQEVIKKLNLRKILSEPELLAEIEPNLELVSKLLALRKAMPPATLETAKQVVRQVVKELTEKLEYPLRQALLGSMNRALRQRNPRKQKEINWLQTIHANLRHYQPSHGTVIPETLIGYGRQNSSLRDVILCIDQSGSMAQSVVYASIFGSVMASLPALDTRLVLFDTAVVDMTDELDDPVELLFGLQLKGGTNIDRALGYCRQQVTRPQDTILVLISDLFEGGNKQGMIRKTVALVEDGVQVIVLLALDDKGAPRFNRKIAQELVEIGVSSFACTPELFPELMGTAIGGHDIGQWAAANGIVTAPSN